MFQPEECYPMKNSHRGSALIFVNTIQRIGAKQEIEHLKFIAELMGLEPFVYLDLTSTQVTNILESITNPGKNVDLSNIQPTPPKLCKDDNMIFIAFSTHGFEEGLKFSDRKDLKYSCLKNFFNIDNCPVLIGKPKVILFNSCRSTNVIFDKSFFTPKVLHNQIETDCFTKNSTDYDIHTTNSDIIVIHSTNFGTVSIRVDDRGSLAIEQIRLTFEKYSNSRLTFESILTRANRELIRTTDTETKEHAEERKIHRIGQCMEWVVTLKYDLIIPPFDSQLAIEIDNYNKEVIDLTDAENLFEDLNIANVLAAQSNLYNKIPLTTYVNSASDEDKEFTASASDGDEEITANTCNKVSNSASDGDEEFTSNASDGAEEITANESDGDEEITANGYNNMSSSASDSNEEITTNGYNNMTNCASDEDKEFTASASDGDEEITSSARNIVSNCASDEDKEFTASASDGDEEITSSARNIVSNCASVEDKEFIASASDGNEEITANGYNNMSNCASVEDKEFIASASDGNEEITANGYNNMSNFASVEDKEFTASASDGDEEITSNARNIVSNSASDEDKEIASKFSNKSSHFRNSYYGVRRFKNPQLKKRQNSPSSRNKVYNNEIAGTPNRVSHNSKNITSKYVRENNYTHLSNYKHLFQWLDIPNGNQDISQTNSMTINHSPCETYNHQLNLSRSPFEYSLQVKKSVNAKRTENKIIMYDNGRNSNKKLDLNRSASELDGIQRKKRKY